MRKLKESSHCGLTRDEMKLYFAEDTGFWFEDKLLVWSSNGRKDFVRNTREVFDSFRDKFLQSTRMKACLRSISTASLLERFSRLPHNICILGDKRITILYCRHQLAAYTTGIRTKTFKWHKLTPFLRDSLKKHASANATIDVYHHKGEFLGTVQKSSSLFTPANVDRGGVEMDLPHHFVIDPNQD